MGKRTNTERHAFRFQTSLLLTGLVARESVRSFLQNHNLGNAATLAYYGFLSLMPLLVLVVYLLGFFMTSSEAILGAVQGMTDRLFPTSSEAILKDVLSLAQAKTWGLVGVIILLWSMTPFVDAIRVSVERIFKVQQRKNFLKDKVFNLIVVLALLLLFIALAAGKMMPLPSVRLHETMTSVVRLIFVLLGSLSVVCAFYKVFAPVKLSLREILSGAVVTVILLAAIRPLFGLILRFNPDYGYAFGSLKTIFLLLVWVYYTFAVILFGAETIATVRRREALLLRGVFLGHARISQLSSRLMSRFIRTYPENDVLFREGDVGDEMFYIVEGEIELTKGTSLVAHMGQGRYFGEMSMLLQSPRTATATVRSSYASLIVISEKNFHMILRENPEIVYSILVEMARRLKETSSRLQR